MTRLHYDSVWPLYPSEFHTVVEGALQSFKEHPEYVDANLSGYLLQKMGWEPSMSIAAESMAKYVHFGQQTFELGPELQEMFCQTSLASVPREALRLPYPAFYLALPECAWSIWGGPVTQWHTVYGVYVVEQGDSLKLLIWGPDNELSRGPGDDATVWFHLDLTECFNKYGDLENYIKYLLHPDNDAVMQNDSLWPESEDTAKKQHLRMQEVYLNVIRTVVNLVLYLQTEAAEADKEVDPRRRELRAKVANAKNPGKKKKYQRQLDNLSKATVVKVGQSLETRMSALRSQPGVQRAQWVRGHWHRYWVGKGRTKLLPKWIHPYPKNLEAEAKVEKRTYEVTRLPEPDDPTP